MEEVRLSGDRQEELQPLFDLATSKGLRVSWVGSKQVAKAVDNHQGVSVTLSGQPHWDDERAHDGTVRVAFLDGITDPHNLGAILRTA